MTDETFEDIKGAVAILMAKKINKLEGNGWIAYRVGSIIRIDIKENNA